MSSKNNKQTKTTKTLARSTAEASVPRGLMFLRTVGTDSNVRAALERTGFSLGDLKQGWSLVLAACSAPVIDVSAPMTLGPVADATQKLASWQSTMFPRAQAALRRLHPEQESFLFDNLIAGQGAAVVAVAMFLDRCDALESSPARKSTRKADHAALATLTQRGVTSEERKTARHLVHVVESTAAPPPVEDVTPAIDARTQALIELHAWLQDWSDCARTVITRRDQLLRLGIGKRRSRTPAPPPVASPPPPAPAPVVAPALPAAQTNGISNGALLLAAHGGDHA